MPELIFDSRAQCPRGPENVQDEWRVRILDNIQNIAGFIYGENESNERHWKRSEKGLNKEKRPDIHQTNLI